MNGSQIQNDTIVLRVRTGVVALLLGLVIFILGVDPGLFGLDRSPVTGFVQIIVFLGGLAMMWTGGYLALNALWTDRQKSIPADIGSRLLSTGYLISFTSGLADVFGFGSQPLPGIPYFGDLQANGVMLGMAVSIVGLLLMIPPPSRE
jgi:hypothetical protein